MRCPRNWDPRWGHHSLPTPNPVHPTSELQHTTLHARPHHPPIILLYPVVRVLRAPAVVDECVHEQRFGAQVCWLSGSAQRVPPRSASASSLRASAACTSRGWTPSRRRRTTQTRSTGQPLARASPSSSPRHRPCPSCACTRICLFPPLACV